MSPRLPAAASPPPKSVAAWPTATSTRDGDPGLLLTTNQGPAYLYRNQQLSGNRGLRLRLTGTKSNRDAIGALARVFTPDGAQSRRVKSGSSYLSQSELTLTFGLGKRDAATRLVIEWPSGGMQEFKNVKAGSYQCTEGRAVLE